MKVIKPIAIADATLISSTATETVALYNAATTYALGDRVRLDSTHRIYECIQAPSTGKQPDTNPLWWSDIGPANVWAMFDAETSTQTSAATPLTVVLAPGYVSALALLGLDGSQLSVSVTDGPGGTQVYSRTVALDGAVIDDWYDYFFEPSDQLEEVVLTDLPPYFNARVSVSVSGVAGSTVKCGHLALGSAYPLGDAQYGASAGIIDFSRKDTNAQGQTTLLKRKFSKRMSLRLWLDNTELRRVQRLLADLRATPCAWIGSEDSQYAPLVVFGFYRDFSLEVAYPKNSFCNLEIEGLA